MQIVYEEHKRLVCIICKILQFLSQFFSFTQINPANRKSKKIVTFMFFCFFVFFIFNIYAVLRDVKPTYNCVYDVYHVWQRGAQRSWLMLKNHLPLSASISCLMVMCAFTANASRHYSKIAYHVNLT